MKAHILQPVFCTTQQQQNQIFRALARKTGAFWWGARNRFIKTGQRDASGQARLADRSISNTVFPGCGA